MSNGMNKAIIIGNLGAEPDVRNLPGGGQVTNLRVATSETWNDKQTGEKKESTEWHRVVLFGRTAEVAAQYLGKGSQVYIEGRIQTRKWQDKEGTDRYTTEIVGSQIQMLGSGYGQQQQNKSQGQRQAPPDRQEAGGGGEDDLIPFAAIDGRFS